MSSIRKWIASRVFSLSNDTQGLNGSTSSGDGLFHRSFSPSSSSGDSSFRAGTSYGELLDINPSEDQSYFSVIYNHYRSKMKQNIMINEKVLTALMLQFYNANEDLSFVSTELDTFDGRKDTDRCSALVNSLKIAQDRVVTLIFRIMDEIGCERASREYRLKFPDELLTGEGIESLNSQIWFGAECLTAGSTITNNQDKSNYLRPIARNLTTTLEQIRHELRACCSSLPKCPRISDELRKKLENFDNLFSAFEYDYVKAMLQIKNCEDIENLQELTYLFYETMCYALKKGLITQEDVDGCQPNVMIALPRLSIVRGLLQGYGSVVCKRNRDDLTSILRPFHTALLEFQEVLAHLNADEIFFLEKLLCNHHENIDWSSNNSGNSKDNKQGNDAPDQTNTLPDIFNKHVPQFSPNAKSSDGETEEKAMQVKSTRYISASVDFLLNNRNDCLIDEQFPNNNHQISFLPIFRFNSLPNLNFHSTKEENGEQSKTANGDQERLRSQHSSSSSRDSLDSTTPSSSLSPISVFTSSSSSISVELDFLKQFKDMLKRTQLKSITKNRSTSSNFFNLANCPAASDMEPRAKTVAADFKPEFNKQIFTPTTSAFSNHSNQKEDTFCCDDLPQLDIEAKKILHQLFVMISRIADEFQTNFASELRNILCTVFLLQEDQEEADALNGLNDSENDLLIKLVDVQIGQIDVDGASGDRIEEGIDANEYLSFENLPPSTSFSSQEAVAQKADMRNNEDCDNGPMTNKPTDDLYRSDSADDEASMKDQIPSNSQVESSYHRGLEDQTENVENQLPQRKNSNGSICSSNSSNSCRSLQNSLVTSSSTTIEEAGANRGEFPPFMFPANFIGTESTLSSPMIPFIGTVPPRPPTASVNNRNLLLPPIWIPDDLVTTCKTCAQGFNLIRRRHHCRRCGQIFCHQCSNNFVLLECFGYAKPVRVCNTCLALHQQQQSSSSSTSSIRPPRIRSSNTANRAS